MNTVTKVAMGIVGIGALTAVLLPNRQTIGVIGAIQKLFSGSLNTAIMG